MSPRPKHAHLELVSRGELLDQLVADIAMLRVGLAMLGEKLDIVRLESVVIFECTEKSAARKVIRILVAAVGRRDLFQNMVAAQRDIEPADTRQHRSRQKVFFDLAALQFLGCNANALAEAQKQGAMA